MTYVFHKIVSWFLVLVQLGVVVIYSFTNIPISGAACLIICVALSYVMKAGIPFPGL